MKWQIFYRLTEILSSTILAPKQNHCIHQVEERFVFIDIL